MKYYAHTAEDRDGRPDPCQAHWQRLAVHLHNVAKSAKKFARPFNLEAEASVAGLLHDLGKYSDRFQQRLRNPTIHRINHWASGAAAAKQQGGRLVPFVIDGHHAGIPSWDRDTEARSLRNTLLTMQQASSSVTGFSETLPELLARFEADGLKTAKVAESKADAFADALRTRFLFSCLVDADFLDTEKHFQPETAARRDTPGLQADRALSALLASLDSKSKEGQLNRLRGQLLQDCLAAAGKQPGLFTLTAPTGGGKTLASLAFALKHASLHNEQQPDPSKHFRRVIVVIPYTTIIEQTAQVYREVFEPVFGPHYVLEHHSAVAPRERDSDAGRDAEEEWLRRARLAAENWDAPLIVTTSVQFFESLFSNKPSDCRKLHNIAKSVVMFDEVQTLPIKLVPSLLSAVNCLCGDYGVTAVFGTATQPAFTHAAMAIRGGWTTTEISSEPRKMAEALKRTVIARRPDEQRPSWAELADELRQHPRVLCVVNTRAQARSLFQALPAADSFHLSAAMCATHRSDLLGDPKDPAPGTIRFRLRNGLPCRLISTQLIEAGVDVDFPVVYRALGPLDSIIQSAGRCNREGKLAFPGEVIVFRPAEGGTPPGAYRQAAAVTESFLHEHPNAPLHLPETYEQYFARLYGTLGPQSPSEDPVFAASDKFDFPAAAAACRLVDENTRSVLVEYREGVELIKQIRRQKHVDAALARKCQRFTVNLYESEFRKARAQGAVTPLTPDETIFAWSSKYDNNLGACHYTATDLIIGGL
jgi:CRISPR-associated endonuclease/helicase Cas3